MTLRAVTLLAMIERGIQLRRAGHPRLAIGCYQRVIDQDRSDATAWTCLGNALKDVGRIAEAIAAQRQAASLAPGNAAVQLNLAIALRHAEAWHEALAVLDRAAALAPDDAAVAWERALILLQLGHYAAGLTEYEARFALPNGPTLPPGLRVWAGEDPADRTITLLPEQGFGDTFLAMRFVASLQARGARVVLQARAETLRLLATDPSITIFALDQPSPQSDMICPMMSLPRHLATVSTAIPPPWRPRPDSQAQAKAAMLVPRRAGTMQVGICWAGSDGFADNRRRSVPLDALLSLLELPDVSLFSLQKGRAAADLAPAVTAGLVTDLGPMLDDFAETAAVLARLDLVITTDSAVAHLAGSVGIPVWVLLHRPAYWIYGTAGTSTPWYPAMRLFRQPQPGDWAGTMSEVIQAFASVRALPPPAPSDLEDLA